MSYNNGSSSMPSSGMPAFTVGAVAGAMIGAGVGLLFAPHSGAILRRRIRRYTNRAIEDAVDGGRDAMDAAMEWGKDHLDDGIDKMKKVAKQTVGINWPS